VQNSFIQALDKGAKVEGKKQENVWELMSNRVQTKADFSISACQ